MGKNKNLLSFDNVVKKCVWQYGYVLSQQQLAASKSEIIEQLKERNWIEFAGKNQDDRYPFYKDYKRSRLFFNGKNTIPMDRVLDDFFHGHEELKKIFIHRYSQGPMQTVSSFFSNLQSTSPQIYAYILLGALNNSVVNFTLQAEELYAELVSSNLELVPMISRGDVDENTTLPLPGGVKILFKLKPEGFELQAITVTNILLQSIIMGEPLNFENQQVREMAVLEEHANPVIRNLARQLSNELHNKQADNYEKWAFFTAISQLLFVITQPEYKDTFTAKLAAVVLKEALELQPKIPVKTDLPLITNLLTHQIQLVKTPNTLAVIEDYHQAAKAVYSKPWGKRLGGAALLAVGALAIIGMVVIAGVTFGAGLIPASALLMGLVFGVGGATMLGGIGSGIFMEYRAHQETRYKTDIEGASKIAVMANYPGQVKTAFSRQSRARSYAEAHPEVFNSNFIQATPIKKTDYINFLNIFKKNNSASKKLLEPTIGDEQQDQAFIDNVFKIK